MKVASGISLDEDVNAVFVEHPYLRKSAFMNDAVREKMIAHGLLKGEA